MKNNKIKLVIFLSIFFLLIFFIFYIFFLKNKNKKSSFKNFSNSEEIIPTVDSSVKIELKKLKKGEIILTILNEPKNTDSIEFELTYNTFNNDIEEGKGIVEQGVIGKCYKFSDYWQCGESNEAGGKKIVLGTCSSGVCRYHNVVGKLKLLLRFSGNYGIRIFEKDYEL